MIDLPADIIFPSQKLAKPHRWVGPSMRAIFPLLASGSSFTSSNVKTEDPLIVCVSCSVITLTVSIQGPGLSLSSAFLKGIMLHDSGESTDVSTLTKDP